ncbi:hypothetical protein PENSPDRAFT_693936 [Peniophora sp. CONT]|nr:hypothetical protein PENSPDRAFT_693936 [Peniophora sp. CONT]
MSARVYGRNVLPARASKSLPRLTRNIFTDCVLIILSVAAVVSLVLDFVWESGFEPARDPQPPADWVEGTAVIIAVMAIVLAGGLKGWQEGASSRFRTRRRHTAQLRCVFTTYTFLAPPIFLYAQS